MEDPAFPFYSISGYEIKFFKKGIDKYKSIVYNEYSKKKEIQKMPKNIYCIIDTETLGVTKKWIYDIGCVIIDKNGNKLHEQRWSVKEIMEIPGVEKLAYYGWKFKNFYHKLPSMPFELVKEEFHAIFEQFKVTHICAYNLAFDFQAIQDTSKKLNSGEFFENEFTFIDLWNACCDNIFQQKKFPQIAIENNWVSPAGNYRTTAEVAYRFITKDYKFKEDHTALEDARIESEILHHILKGKQKITKDVIIFHPWKKVQRSI
jgi:hypothetical protein